LKRAIKKHTDNKNKALNACYLSIAEKRRGNEDAARKYLEQARKLNPECSLLERARNEILSINQ
jgi:hypothetical protein